MRERGQNVMDAPHDAPTIAQALRQQIAHGPYESQPIYGDGKAGKRIAELLATKTVNIQKRITY
jgi:hypothetical protein